MKHKFLIHLNPVFLVCTSFIYDANANFDVGALLQKNQVVELTLNPIKNPLKKVFAVVNRIQTTKNTIRFEHDPPLQEVTLAYLDIDPYFGLRVFNTRMIFRDQDEFDSHLKAIHEAKKFKISKLISLGDILGFEKIFEISHLIRLTGTNVDPIELNILKVASPDYYTKFFINLKNYFRENPPNERIKYYLLKIELNFSPLEIQRKSFLVAMEVDEVKKEEQFDPMERIEEENEKETEEVSQTKISPSLTKVRIPLLLPPLDFYPIKISLTPLNHSLFKKKPLEKS